MISAPVFKFWPFSPSSDSSFLLFQSSFLPFLFRFASHKKRKTKYKLQTADNSKNKRLNQNQKTKTKKTKETNPDAAPNHRHHHRLHFHPIPSLCRRAHYWPPHPSSEPIPLPLRPYPTTSWRNRVKDLGRGEEGAGAGKCV